jgi:hypothetical protein
VGAKGLCLAGPPRSGETSRPDSRPGGQRGEVWAAWWQEKQDEVVDRSRCRVAAQTEVYTRGLRWFTTKPSGYLAEPQNQDQRLGGWRRDPGAPRSFDAGGCVAGSQGLRREDAVYGDGVVV